jgi:hypothetical protein
LAQRVILHIGAMKSGTSFIQNVLGENKANLAAAGVLFPGERWRSQVRAVQDLIKGGPDPDSAQVPDDAWSALAAEINAWSGTSVISMEFLAPRTKEQIARAVASFPGAELRVLLTCRDLGRTIPAMWLESVQNGSPVDWPDYLEAVRTRDRSVPVGRNFWRHQDIPRIAARWATGVGTDHLTLVTVPPSGSAPDTLWSRVAGVIGIDPATCTLDVRANPSIGVATALVLRRLNERWIAEGGELPAGYDRFVKHVLAKRGLVRRQGSEPRLGLDAAWVRKAGDAQRAKLDAAGYDVAGDLAELAPRPVSGVHTSQVDESAQLDAAVDGIAHLVESWTDLDAQQRRKARKLRRRLAKAAE